MAIKITGSYPDKCCVSKKMILKNVVFEIKHENMYLNTIKIIQQEFEDHLRCRCFYLLSISSNLNRVVRVICQSILVFRNKKFIPYTSRRCKITLHSRVLSK